MILIIKRLMNIAIVSLFNNLELIFTKYIFFNTLKLEFLILFKLKNIKF